MSIRRFSVFIVLVSTLILAFGAFLFLSGKADDGRFVSRAGDDPMEMMARNLNRVEQRKQATTPLLIGGIGLLLGLGLLVSSKPDQPQVAPGGAPGATSPPLLSPGVQQSLASTGKVIGAVVAVCVVAFLTFVAVMVARNLQQRRQLAREQAAVRASQPEPRTVKVQPVTAPASRSGSPIVFFQYDQKMIGDYSFSYTRGADGRWTGRFPTAVKHYREWKVEDGYVYLEEEVAGAFPLHLRIPVAGGRVTYDQVLESIRDYKPYRPELYSKMFIPDQWVLPGQTSVPVEAAAAPTGGASFAQHQSSYEAAPLCAALKAGALPPNVVVSGTYSMDNPRGPCPWIDALYVRDPDGSTWAYERGGTALSYPTRFPHDAGRAEQLRSVWGESVPSYYTWDELQRLPAGSFIPPGARFDVARVQVKGGVLTYIYDDESTLHVLNLMLNDEGEGKKLEDFEGD